MRFVFYLVLVVVGFTSPLAAGSPTHYLANVTPNRGDDSPEVAFACIPCIVVVGTARLFTNRACTGVGVPVPRLSH